MKNRIAMFEREFQRGTKANYTNEASINESNPTLSLLFNYKNAWTYLMAKILNIFLNWCTTKL